MAENDLQIFRQDDTKQPDYLKVLVLVYHLLQSTLSTKELIDLLETLNTEDWVDVTEISFKAEDPRPMIAQGIVDRYLLKRLDKISK